MSQRVFLTLIAIVTISVSIRTPPLLPMRKLAGGRPAKIGDAPYLASLLVYGRHYCGASILSENKVLTAAHCTDKFSLKSLSIRVGSQFHNRGGQVIKVVDVCQHPCFNIKTVDYDVSVITLAMSIRLGGLAKRILLQPAGMEVPYGALATVSGWGSLYSGGPVSDRIQVVRVPRVRDNVCRAFYKKHSITNRMFCFGFEQGGRDACQGDSGGPLVVNGVQVGIVSWGEGCARVRYPGVYSKISELRNHIDECQYYKK